MGKDVHGSNAATKARCDNYTERIGNTDTEYWDKAANEDVFHDSQDLQDMYETSRVIILKKAARYLTLLHKIDLVLQNDIDHVAKKNAELRQQLQLAVTTFYSLPTAPTP